MCHMDMCPSKKCIHIINCFCCWPYMCALWSSSHVIDHITLCVITLWRDDADLASAGGKNHLIFSIGGQINACNLFTMFWTNLPAALWTSYLIAGFCCMVASIQWLLCSGDTHTYAIIMILNAAARNIYRHTYVASHTYVQTHSNSYYYILTYDI